MADFPVTVSDAAGVDAALLAALRIQGPRERLRQVLARGFTTLQVYERLAGDVRDALSGGAEGPMADRRGVDAAHRALLRLVADGRVIRRRASYSVILNTKGERGMVVDLYSLP